MFRITFLNDREYLNFDESIKLSIKNNQYKISN